MFTDEQGPGGISPIIGHEGRKAGVMPDGPDLKREKETETHSYTADFFFYIQQTFNALSKMSYRDLVMIFLIKSVIYR